MHVDPIPQDSRRHSCSTRSNFVGLDSIKEPTRHSSYEMDLNKEPMIDLNEVPYELESSYFNFQTSYLQPDIMADIPYIFHPYITNIQNVDGDGNCGFRTIAVGLGRVQTDYRYIRQQMIDELQSRYHIYEKMFVVDINTLYESLCFFGSPAPTRYWMSMSEAGVLVVNKFGVIVHYLSTQGSTTIFPLWRGLEEFQYNQAITVALVYNHSHYMMVHLQGEYPIPFVTTY